MEGGERGVQREVGCVRASSLCHSLRSCVARQAQHRYLAPKPLRGRGTSGRSSEAVSAPGVVFPKFGMLPSDVCPCQARFPRTTARNRDKPGDDKITWPRTLPSLRATALSPWVLRLVRARRISPALRGVGLGRQIRQRRTDPERRGRNPKALRWQMCHIAVGSTGRMTQ